jgi:hypothetical protein
VLTCRVATIRVDGGPQPEHHEDVGRSWIPLIVISGVWFVASEVLPSLKLAKLRRTVAGSALAVAGILLIIATHWGQFG